MQVTLITCTWNSKKTIKNCRVSILDQTYDDIEHIIIDNTSDDEKLKIFFLNQYIVKKNSGEASNKNIDNIIIRMLVDYKILTKNKINPLKSIIYKNLSKITQFF
jgi:glycosyltransferase involved in cell wall biosynthesis|tara:strand:- start:260 stop:574 length:315 start_codon:yes stop_codon:yes gene_type:complete